MKIRHHLQEMISLLKLAVMWMASSTQMTSSSTEQKMMRFSSIS